MPASNKATPRAKNPVTGLTELQEEFSRQVVQMGSGARAYRKVYDASRMSQTQVWVEVGGLLKNPSVATRVLHYQQVADRAADISVERIAREMVRVALFDPRELFDERGQPRNIEDLPEDTARAIAGVEIVELTGGGGYLKKYKIADKLKALEMLAKWKRMLVELMESGKAGEFAGRSSEDLQREFEESLRAAVRSGVVTPLDARRKRA